MRKSFVMGLAGLAAAMLLPAASAPAAYMDFEIRNEGFDIGDGDLWLESGQFFYDPVGDVFSTWADDVPTGLDPDFTTQSGHLFGWYTFEVTGSSGDDWDAIIEGTASPAVAYESNWQDMLASTDNIQFDENDFVESWGDTFAWPEMNFGHIDWNPEPGALLEDVVENNNTDMAPGVWSQLLIWDETYPLLYSHPGQLTGRMAQMVFLLNDPEDAFGLGFENAEWGVFDPSQGSGVLTAEIVPEPGTMSLLGLGLAGLAYRRFRRGRA